MGKGNFLVPRAYLYFQPGAFLNCSSVKILTISNTSEIEINNFISSYLIQRWQSIQTIEAEGSARIGRIKLKGLLDSVRCFKVEARFGSMLDVLNRAPARFESSILKVLLGSIKLGPSCSIRLDIV